MPRLPATFPLRSSKWTALLVRPFAWRAPAAEVLPDRVRVRVGVMGRADVPLALVERVHRMPWPWWGGIGVRIGRGLVAFVTSSGPCAVVELTEPVSVRVPLGWKTARIVVGVDDLEGFIDALGEARRALDGPPGGRGRRARQPVG